MRRAKPLPIIEEIRNFLSYSSETGELRWLKSPANRVKIGNTVTHVDVSSGYITFRFKYRLHMAHRVAWYLHTGKQPVNHIDHINGIKTDNRFCNLREATTSQNLCNRGKQRNSTSGYKGVYWDKIHQNWYSRIQHQNRDYYLGRFPTPEEAHRAYCVKADELHKEFAHHQ